MEPSIPRDKFPAQLIINAEGFIEPALENGGIFAAGAASDALDVNRAVQHATGAALRAIQVVNRVAGQEG
jgi:quinone-modifying oxidoreductase subunit QmoA